MGESRRVHYGAKEMIPAHDHTDWGAAYVYLNDSGPVIFKHIGLSYGAITRPATKAGSFRLYKAVKEIHEVENPGDSPSDFLRVEFKTEAVNASSLRGKFYREEYPEGENFRKIQFENEQVRATRLIIIPAKKIEASATLTEPALLIALSTARFKLYDQKGKAKQISLEPGQTIWLTAGQQAQLENTGKAPAELVRFDLKTKPAAGAGEKAHDHDQHVKHKPDEEK